MDISCATAQVASDLLNTLAILSDTTVRSAVDQNLQLYWWQFLAEHLYPTFLDTGTINETLQQSGKQDSFRHLLESSASMYASSHSQFFRTTSHF